ncbi:MAG: carboxymuconolactone decarboxylase family protein [Thermoanaerobaculia bacterium]|nr:carboxymuconolactone decarboxylase family protein [Thermoanaerobaculia bacterium]
MSLFDVHTLDSVSADGQEALQAAQGKFGFVPNLIGVMAEAPALANGYLSLAGIFGSSSLSAQEQQVVLLAVSYVNDCRYCVAAHTTVAQGTGLSRENLDALRSGGDLPDAKQNALATFSRALVESNGWAGDAAVQAFLDAGYSRQNVLEVVLGIGVKTLSNYTNHLADTPLDGAFQANAWNKAESAAA